jgi:putative restriction endonuclease
MTPLDRTRLEKAAADCGFELSPVLQGDGRLVLGSYRFPESVRVSIVEDEVFLLEPSSHLLLELDGNSVGLQLAGYAALYAALQGASAIARTLPNRVAEKFRVTVATMPTSTEAERLVVQRVGQGLFREALLDYWQGRCCVTGLAVPGLLRASHIKPWARCASDEERLDVFNGFLLAPHVDALFDDGWISFDESGEVIVSAALSTEARFLLGVSNAWKVGALKATHHAYLAYHREHELRMPGV